jgi:hypothetical protein
VTDPEAVYQDADLLQDGNESESRQASALHRKRICTHGWFIGPSELCNRSRAKIEHDRQHGMFPDRPTDESITCQSDIPAKQCLCLECGEIVPDPLEGRYWA